ncbi:M23 family metallopeptidase [Ekhidna sp.]|uniref:M23 family metallopeptidase n=1 Tax=Ekhidna sp. TaxID=2608089 RepID=UPI003B50CADF
MKHQLNYLLIPLCIVICISCSEYENLQVDQPATSITKVFDFVTASEDPQLANLIDQIKNQSNSRASNFTWIDSVLRVQTDSTLNYTFSSSIANGFENQIFMVRGERIYTFIMQYFPTSEWLMSHDIANFSFDEYSGEVKLLNQHYKLFQSVTFDNGDRLDSYQSARTTDCGNYLTIEWDDEIEEWIVLVVVVACPDGGGPVDSPIEPFPYTNPDPSEGDENDGSGGNSGGSGVVGRDVCNPNTEICSNGCPPGYEVDSNGLCKPENAPCEGDPVPNPEIASQANSGVEGGMHGCTRYGTTCDENNRTKWHDGIDIENEYGNPVYAMYDGFIYNTLYQSSGYGYWTQIQSTVDGKTIITQYAHLQKNGRITSGEVEAGDVIGYQGDSGNLSAAIANGSTVSHVHIGVLEHDGSNSWNYNTNFEEVDPRDWLSTTIDDEGTSETDCN